MIRLTRLTAGLMTAAVLASPAMAREDHIAASPATAYAQLDAHAIPRGHAPVRHDKVISEPLRRAVPASPRTPDDPFASMILG